MIDLTALSAQTASPRLLDFGSEQQPFLGGVTQRLDRIGSRHALDVQLPPMRVEPDGRRWISRLIQAKQLGAYFAFPQVDFHVGAPGSPTVDGAVTGGVTLPIKGGTPRYAIREGQWLNVIKSGRTYLYSAAAQTILDGSGDGEIMLDVPLRCVLADGDQVEIREPVIEGYIAGDEWGWTIEMARTVGLSFTIVERA